jgi:LacI family transcriptional regulator
MNGMKRSPTLKEVAAALGVSSSTVSRVVNDEPGVHESTRKRIKEAVDMLGYRRHPTAAALKTGRAELIHMVVEAEDAALLPPILAGAAGLAHDRGYRVVLSTLDYERRSRNVDQRTVAGVIVAPAFEHAVRLDWLARGPSMPVVCVYGYATDPRHVSVVSDDRGGACLATSRLIARGCRRIAYIGGVAHWIQSKRRLQGYKAALAENGLAFDPALVEKGDWSRESGYEACRRLLGLGRPDGIFCANDKMASGVLHCLAEQRLAVPGDVAVVGFDDRDLCQFVTPRLTSVALPLAEMGRRATEVLVQNIDALASGEKPIRGTIRVPCRLVERDSA